jgi:ER-bound oxygenase mpaB/B'/Rubber oxygenase, catalytic domain
MTTSIQDLREKVARQKDDLAVMYGDIDFGHRPERFTDDPDAESHMRSGLIAQRPRLLANTEQVARIEAFTMLGDTVADAYAALLPDYGFQRLADMLTEACDNGVESVGGAPPELIAMIKDMERVPDWVDMALVEEGARLERKIFTHVAPYAIRGGFVGTFMNSYAALPMALTGALNKDNAARRIRETSAFFTATTLPGALERHGAGFKAAARVRLMHSMVRFNVLRHGKWDSEVYGVPIPQADQMPAGLIAVFLLSRQILKSGRLDFTPGERARVEFARYRCYLLGLPEDLLPDSPRAIVALMATRHATLRKAYDDATCGELLRATMAAYLEPDHSARSRSRDWFERSFSKAFFIRSYLNGSNERAREMGIGLTTGDRVRAAAVAAMLAAQIAAYRAIAALPSGRRAADAMLVRKLSRQLGRLGHAEFTTDAARYQPVHDAA